MHSKLNFAIWENIYEQFQEDNKPDILIKTMRLLEIEITLTQVRQIVIIDHDYNAYSNKQAEKKISQIEQFNKSTAHILVCTDVTIKQQIRKCYNKRQKIQKMIMRKA